MRGAPDSGRGRERERACLCLCREAQFSCKKAALNHAPSCHVIEYGPITAHTGCTIAGLPRFLTALRRTLPGKYMVGVRFPGQVRIALYTAVLFC
jgi:hypothetical protein